MKSEGKENIVVISVIVLCFVVTLGLCLIYSGSGFIGAALGGGEESYYAIAVGGFDDITLARTTAELIKGRGGAGYVLKDKEEYEIFYAVYPSKDEAQSVLSSLGENAAYLKELKISSSKLKWADNKRAVQDALKYFDIAFDCFYSLSNSLNKDEATLDDVKNGVGVLIERLKDIKTTFYSEVSSSNSDRITEIKLALVTAIALAENATISDKAGAASSLRYQLVQLTLTHMALMSRL